MEAPVCACGASCGRPCEYAGEHADGGEQQVPVGKGLRDGPEQRTVCQHGAAVPYAYAVQAEVRARPQRYDQGFLCRHFPPSLRRGHYNEAEGSSTQGALAGAMPEGTRRRRIALVWDAACRLGCRLPVGPRLGLAGCLSVESARLFDFPGIARVPGRLR